VVLSGAITAVLAVPGVAYILTPLRKRNGGSSEFQALARLGDLKVGEPQSFPVIEARTDAWVRYPPEPVGSVWLIRQPEGTEPPVIAMTSECPHLGCAVNLTSDREEFLCPCHDSRFTLNGKPLNETPPRPMDRLDIEVDDPSDPNAQVLVKFQRFRTMTEEKIPIA